jgi:polyferredoxin/formate hydrogenlyase subunit 6/NADH:ubiquinone oxidoreductase subunit I
MNRLIRLRRLSQLLFLVLFVDIIWSTTYPLTGPLSPEILFKINPLVMVMTAISARVGLAGLSAALVMIVLTLIFGRFFCGWVCPLGTMIDITARLSRRRHWFWSVPTRKARLFKFGVLFLIFCAAALGIQVVWVLDPMVIMARFVSLNLIPAVTHAVDSVFVFAMTALGLRDVLIDVYRGLKASVLGIQVRFFAHAGFLLAFFVFILGSVALARRFWCRCVCPLGALYALVARAAWMRRLVDVCKHCTLCVSRCRMGAIGKDMSYDKGECILCMDCIYDCPQHATRFGVIARRHDPPPQKGAGISRRNFLFLLALPLIAVSRKAFGAPSAWPGVIRPPGSGREEKFLDRCVRCGNCMKVCITNGLQPLMFEEGLEGVWTPQLVPEVGYCEYQCTLCGQVCPTAAIPRLGLEEKKRTRLGLAVINPSICIPWAYGQECLVCQEHCPIAEKAIKIEPQRTASGAVVGAPVVDPSLCVGCGICQNKCPVRPDRAIRVHPFHI